VTGEQPNAGGIMANGEPVNVDYMMRRDGEG
jgi:hypothetical protein